METGLVAVEEFVNVPDEQLNLLMTQIMTTKMSRMEAKLREMETAQALIAQQGEEYNNKLREIATKQERTQELAVESMRVKQPHFGYVNQGDFGRYFVISIGPKVLGKLLKIVGLAMRSKSETVPYRQYIPKYAIARAHDKFSTFSWNYEECLGFIDSWLKDNGLFESFYSHKTEKEREQFINHLYDSMCSQPEAL